MNDDEKRVCPYCEGDQKIVIERTFFNETFQIFRCLNCEQLFSNPRVIVIHKSQALSESEAEYHAQKRKERENERRRRWEAAE